jgi:hypothetical protein
MSSPTTTASAVSYTATRLLIPTRQPFDTFVSKLEEAVPHFSPDVLAGVETWTEVTRIVETLTPHAFVFFFEMTPSNATRIAGSTTRSRVYLMGNPVTVEGMYRHHPGVMVHAPLQVEVYENAAHEAIFSIQRPSAAFASFEIDAVAEVGEVLDRQVDDLLAFLGVSASDRGILSAPRSLL